MLIRRERLLLGLGLACGVLGLAVPAMAEAAWNQPWTGVGSASGAVNQSSSQNAGMGDLEAIDGVPYVAWVEHDGVNAEVRVGRLDSSTHTWEQPWNGVDDGSGAINASSSQNALSAPSLTAVNGLPYVAWTESDGTNSEVRVARLDPSVNAWEQPWGNATDGGINHSADADADRVSLTAVGGVPYVAWEEADGTPERELRVARLTSADAWEEPWSVSATDGGVTRSSERGGYWPSLTAVGGVPFVAWQEWDGSNYEIRVARLDSSTWEEPWMGVGPTSGGINQSTSQSAERPSLTQVAGVPFVAWQELAGGPIERVRVARLNASTNAWEQPWDGVGPTSGGVQSTNDAASSTSLTDLGGVPYVAWAEADQFSRTNFEVRVARLDPSTDSWEQPWLGVSSSYGGINESPNQDAQEPRLTAVAGIPFVAWHEAALAMTDQARVARLEPEFLGLAASASAGAATLVTSARTFGLPYTLGFRYGAALESETTTDTAAIGVDEMTVIRQVAGLRPNTTYRYRPFAVAGVPAPKALGPIGVFTTAGVGPSEGPAADTKAPQTRIGRHPRKRTRKRRARFRFFATEPGSTFECKLDRRRFRPCTSPKTVEARPGRHVFQVRGRDAAGNLDRSPARFSWTILKSKRAR